MTTVSMTVQPHITGTVGVPRAVFLRFPAGNQMGEAGKPQQQRAILTAALEAAYAMQTPGTIVELPYRWRRFPLHEEPVWRGTSQGPRHPQAEAIGEALDSVVRLAREYTTYLQGRLAQAEAGPAPIPDLANALRLQINREFILTTGRTAPDYWDGTTFPEGFGDEPVTMVTWYDARDYCAWRGKRLPSQDAWRQACQAPAFPKRGDIWEWTQSEEKGWQVLCGPKGTCDCSHRYRPAWKNAVKGFRCARGQPMAF